jgi:hypothetical protein
VQGLFQPDNRIDGGVFSTRFDFLNKAPTQIGFLGQTFLSESGGSAKATDILSKRNMG